MFPGVGYLSVPNYMDKQSSQQGDMPTKRKRITNIFTTNDRVWTNEACFCIAENRCTHERTMGFDGLSQIGEYIRGGLSGETYRYPGIFTYIFWKSKSLITCLLLHLSSFEICERSLNLEEEFSQGDHHLCIFLA
jgi:hypothetical protein